MFLCACCNKLHCDRRFEINENTVTEASVNVIGHVVDNVKFT